MNRSTLEAATVAEGASAAEIKEAEVEKANPLFSRWISNSQGSKLAVPEEWLDKRVGKIFTTSSPQVTKLVTEVS